MTKMVNIHEAKTHLSRLLERVAEGEEIIIARHGKPVARLAPLRPEREPREPGLLQGQVELSDDFDAALPAELLDAFYRGRIEPEDAP